MSIRDIKRKIVYWDGVNITFLPHISFDTRRGSLHYKNKVYKGNLSELVSLVNKEYKLVTFNSLGLDIIEVKDNYFVVKILGKYHIIETSALVTFMLKYLLYYSRGISFEEVSSRYRVMDVLSISFQEFIEHPHKEELLLKISPEFVLYDGVVYPSLEYLQGYLKLSNSKIFKLCCDGLIKGEDLYKRSAPYGSEELLSVRKVQSNLVLDFSDGTVPYIAPELFELFMRNAIPLKPSYDLGKGELGIRDINTLYHDFYLGNFTLNKHTTKAKGVVYITKRYDSSISNYVSPFTVRGNKEILQKLSQYCYYQGLSSLAKLGISEAKDKLTTLEGYPLFKSMGEEQFREHVKKFATLSYSLDPTIMLAKKQVRFLASTFKTNTPLGSYLEEIEDFIKENKEFFTVTEFLGFTPPSRDVFISLYKELQGDRLVYKDHLGREYVRLSDIATAWGIPDPILRHRMSRNWDIERALTEPATKFVSFFGEEIKDHLGNQYDSFSAMCKAYNIMPATLKTRLQGGMPLEEALTKPVRVRRSNKLKK